MKDKIPKLLPCPFCGAEPKTGKQPNGAMEISCYECGATPYVTSELSWEHAASIWNRRTPVGPESFGSKLRAMRADLLSIVTRMNIDRSENIADLAQSALVKVGAVEDAIDTAFNDARDLNWDWEPQTDEERDEAR